MFKTAENGAQAPVVALADVMASIRPAASVSLATCRRLGPLHRAEEVLLGGYNSGQTVPAAISDLEAYVASAKASPNYKYHVRKEHLAQALLDRGEGSAIPVSLCNVDMRFRKPKNANGRKPNAYRYRCETARCPFCSRRLARKRTRELVPAFMDALSQGYSIYTFTVTQPKYSDENALSAQMRLRKSLDKLRPWLLCRKEVEFAALGIDIVCSHDGYHVHAHVTYAGRSLDREALAEKWSLSCPGTSCRPKPSLRVGPSLLKQSYAVCEKEVFSAIFYAIKGEISTHPHRPRYNKWARAIIDLKGHARLYSKWGVPRSSRRMRAKGGLPTDDWKRDRAEYEPHSLSDLIHQATSPLGLASTFHVAGRFRFAAERNRYDTEYLLEIQTRGKRAHDIRERRRNRWQSPQPPPSQTVDGEKALSDSYGMSH